MRPIAIAAAALCGCLVCPVASAKPAEGRQVIDLAICLDTSGSMSGLINAARQKLWAVVNDLAAAEPQPTLRVALLTFGNDEHMAENGWVRLDSEFTTDLDLISQRLFALRTNGGTEYVGRVLQGAATLDWTASDDGLKLVIVAGNESADQDQETPARQMCRSLIARGIMVDAIFCGAATDEVAPTWMEVAKLADGQFAAIDQNDGTIVITTPYDVRLTELSAALNETYIPFGAAGGAGAANQAAQDENAAKLNSAAAASRAATKAQGLYQCAWDLVDACRSGEVKLASVAADELPEAMRQMTAEQRAAYVDSLAGRRGEIQRQIGELSAMRDAHIAEEVKRQALDASKSFDEALRRAVRDQARAKGFGFSEEVAAKDGC